MMGLHCVGMASLIAGRAAGLSQADALRLEDHLAHCATCSAQAHLLDGLRGLSDESAQPLAAGARQRAILQAFALAERSAAPRAARATWLWPSAWGAFVAVAIVVLAVMRGPARGPAADCQVISGEIEHTTGAAASGELETSLASEAGGVVELAHARVQLRARTKAHWSGGSRALRLEQGAVAAEVDPDQHRSFRIETELFRAVVLGTKFEVSPSSVRVERGRVRVERSDGTLLALLGAGEVYECAAAPCAPRPRADRAAASADAKDGSGATANANGVTAAIEEGAAVGNTAAVGTGAAVGGGEALGVGTGAASRDGTAVGIGSAAAIENRAAGESGAPSGSAAATGSGAAWGKGAAPGSGAATARGGATASEAASGKGAAVGNRLDGSAPPTAAARLRGAQRARSGAGGDVAEQLDRARLALAQHNVADARALIAATLAAHPSLRDQAEALSLRAECSLVAGDLAGAAAGYRVVAARFASLPAGESALFASGRIEADLGNRDRARATFGRYLAKYPRGRFAKEAAARLRDLEAGFGNP